jgi:hypothetical protein
VSLDAYPGDAVILRKKAEQEARRAPTLNGITLGPDSPVRPRTKRAKPELSATEHQLQVALFEKVNDPAEQLRRPALAIVHAVPNGGKRSKAVAAKLKAEGVKPGVPDIDCPVARGGYHGLRIEMKRPGQATSPAQADWLYQFAREGYKTALHTTSEGAWAELVAYLDMPRTTLSPSQE